MWSAAFENLSLISMESIVDQYFSPLPVYESKQSTNPSLPQQLLEFLNSYTYYNYPHRTLSGLPTDRDVELVISGNARRGAQTACLMRKQDVLNVYVITAYILFQWGFSNIAI